MKLPQNNIQTETIGGESEESFAIGDMGFILSILRGKLYSNVIGTIVREYACNARDAMREVGKADQPIEIFLPSKLDPSFKVKDFGPGISPERMSNVFIQYGTSTKRNDNVQTGAFGIGAKSGFAYTSQFTISTITFDEKQNKNIKRVYIAYIDKSEVGRMRLVSSLPTSESTGTEIIIGIKPNDIESFRSEVVSNTFFWDVKPKLRGNDINLPKCDYEYQESDIIFEDKNWRILKKSSNYYEYNDNSSTAIIDGVPYPINFSSIEHHLKHELIALARKRSYLYFNNGELTLSASREQLQYDDTTCALLAQRFEEISKKIKNKIININYWNALPDYRTALNKYNLVYSHFSSILPNRDYKIKWRENVLTESIAIGQAEKKIAKIVKYAFNSSNNDIYPFRLIHLSTSSKIVLINDLSNKNKIRHRIKTVLDEYNINEVYVINLEPEKTVQDLKNHIKTNYSIDIDQVFNFKYLSTIPLTDIQTKKYVKREKNKITAYKYGYNSFALKSQDRNWINETIDLEKNSGIYVVLNNGTYKEILDEPIYYNKNNLRKISKIISKDIYGIKKADISKINSNWKTLYDACMEKLDELIPPGVTPELITEYKERECILLNYNHDEKYPIFRTHETIIEKLRKNINKINKDSDMFVYLNEINNVCDFNKKFEIAYLLITFIELTKETNISDLKSSIDIVGKVKKKYPLLGKMNNYGNDIELSEAIDYIHAMDLLHKSKLKSVNKTGT